MTKIMSFVLALVLSSFVAGAQEVPVRDFPPETTPTASPTATPRPTPAANAVAPTPEKEEESWPWWMLPIGVLSGIVAIGGGIWFFFWRKPKEKPAPRRPIGHEDADEPPHHHGGGHGTAIALLLSLTLVGQVWAQTPAPSPTATPASPACEIVKVISEHTVVRSVPNPVTKPADVEFRLAVRGCETPAVKGVEAAARGVSFTDVTREGDVVKAKVVVTTDAETGPARLRLVLADGSKVKSLENVFIDVRSAEVAAAHKVAMAEISRASSVAHKAAKDVATIRTELARVEADLGRQLASVEASALTEAQVRAIVVEALSPLYKEIQVLARVDDAIAGNLHELASATELVAKEKVKKSTFGGKKPHNLEAAKMAEEIRKNLSLEGEGGKEDES